MFCKYCGNENKKDAEFCKNCGKKLRINTEIKKQMPLTINKKILYISIPLLLIAGISIFSISSPLIKMSNVTVQKELKQEIICNKPYIQVGTSCCLDNNNNDICDKDESLKQTSTSKTIKILAAESNSVRIVNTGTSSISPKTEITVFVGDTKIICNWQDVLEPNGRGTCTWTGTPCKDGTILKVVSPGNEDSWRCSETFTDCSKASVVIDDVYIATGTGTGTVIVRNSGQTNDLDITAAPLYSASGKSVSPGQTLPITNFDKGAVQVFTYTSTGIASCAAFSKALVSTNCAGVSAEFDRTPRCT